MPLQTAVPGTPSAPTNVIPFPIAVPANPVVAMRALLTDIESAYALIEAGDVEAAAAQLLALRERLPQD